MLVLFACHPTKIFFHIGIYIVLFEILRFFWVLDIKLVPFIANVFATTTIKGHSKGFSTTKLVNLSRLPPLKRRR